MRIYLFGTIVFLTGLTLTTQFGKSSDENNNIFIQNLEALAGGTQLCSYSCYPEENDCCMACDHCDVIPEFNEGDPKASRCLQQQE